MAVIASTSMGGSGTKAVTTTTLDGTDSFEYTPGATLVLHNPTAGALSPVIDGDGASTVPVKGVGLVDVSTGYEVGSIAAGDTVAIRLDTIRRYLPGTIAVTGSTGLEAQLLEY